MFVAKGCVRCHAVGGAGGGDGPDLAVSLVNKGIFDIAAAMWSHAPSMSRTLESRGEKLPSLAPDEMRDLLAYLLFIGFADEPGDGANGRLLFTAKGCVKCHSPGRQGRAEVGPFLPASIRALPPIGIAQAMWNHGPQMAAKMAALGMERPLWEPGEMADVIAYLRGAAASDVPWTELPGNPATGKALYESRGCAQCHSPGPEGKPLGPDLSRPTWYRTSTEMAAVMWNHEPAMSKAMQASGREVPRFEGTEMADVLAYLYVLRSSARIGDAERGKVVFSSKGCAGCHAEGGPVDLRKSAALTSPAHLASAMWNHAPEMTKAVAEKGMEWPALSGSDVADVLAFLLPRQGETRPAEH